MYRYPYQIISAFSSSDGVVMTLGVQAVFALEHGDIYAVEKEKVNPLEMHDGFSRFVFSIEKSGGKGKSSVYGNIPVCDADEIMTNTMIAQQEVLIPSGSSDNGQVALTMGRHKGLTPMQLLRRDPSAREDLIRTREFLLGKLEQYPANRTQIDAIDRALANEDQATDGDCCFAIYRTEQKPLLSTLRNGQVMNYSINILCYPSRRYPYRITISNDWKKVDEGNTTGGADGKHEELSISLNAGRWLAVTGKMQRQLQAFETTHYIAQYNKAVDAFMYNKRTC